MYSLYDDVAIVTQRSEVVNNNFSFIVYFREETTVSIPKLTFPIIVDFTGDKYWIGKTGPYKYGEAVTAFFVGEDIAGVAYDEGISLVQELEVYLKAFGNYLHPYAKAEKVSEEMFCQLDQSSAGCTVSYAFHPMQGAVALVERYTFTSLRDFLYVELGKAILTGNAPRQCQLCGNWFLHERGSKTRYCERLAPGETERTCREAGARAVFEKKIQDEDTWKLYKRAYKKYYARYMKGNMSESDFKAWVAQAAIERDRAIRQMNETTDAVLRIQITEYLREALNKK